MLNLLMIENDAEKLKKIFNDISSFNFDLRLYISFTGKEALELIKEKDIDIIILDVNIPDFFESNILYAFEKEHKYIKSIIVISNKSLEEFSSNKFLCIYNVLKDIKSTELLNTDLNNIICNSENREREFKSKIYNELYYLKYNPFNKGTVYLCETVYQFYLCRKYNIKLSSSIYPTISYKYDTSINNIKNNIIRASTKSFVESEESKLEGYFGRKIIEKPTTYEIIIAILKHIK